MEDDLGDDEQIPEILDFEVRWRGENISKELLRGSRAGSKDSI